MEFRQESDIVPIPDTHLYLGNFFTTNNDFALGYHDIKHILTFLEFPPVSIFPDKFQYKFFPMRDDIHQELIPIVKQAIPYIEECYKKDQNVYIHCFMGISRSVSVIIAWLMWKKDITFEKAYSIVKHVRFFARPNSSFYTQLKLWESEKSHFRV